jgi:hypothetical protein
MHAGRGRAVATVDLQELRAARTALTEAQLMSKAGGSCAV